MTFEASTFEKPAFNVVNDRNDVDESSKSILTRSLARPLAVDTNTAVAASVAAS